MRVFVLAGALAIAPVAAWPCGVCAEDKVAATYDYDVIARAIKNRQVVVFCELSGAYDAKSVAAVTSRQRGVDPRSIRLSKNPATLSFAIDAKQQSPERAVRSIRSSFPAGVGVSIVRIL